MPTRVLGGFAMSDTSSSTSTTSADTASSTRDAHSVVSRVLSLSIFFVGVGVFAAVGFALLQTGMLEQYRLTFFSVGAVVGVVGLLLWIRAR